MVRQDSAPIPRTPTADPDTAKFTADLIALIPLLRSIARSLTGKDAEDYAQEALAKAWQARASFTPGTNLKAWLFTILRNEFYSNLRQAWRQVPWNDAFQESVQMPPGQQQWAAEMADAVRAMDTLPERQRDALILIGAGGYSYEDAASVVKTRVGTVKSRVGRARVSLKKVLDGGRLPVAKAGPAVGSAMNKVLDRLSHLGSNGRALHSDGA